MQIAFQTDVGKIRPHNEDSVCTGANFAVIADGMGGHNKGEIASGMVVEMLESVFKSNTFENSVDSLKNAIQTVNRSVYARSVTDAECKGMGTTLVSCTWDKKKIIIASVGDSRCYEISEKSIRQLTRDHTLVQELIDDGSMTAEEALHAPNRHVITRAVGTVAEEQADILELKRKKGMQLLLCSDGLINHVTDDLILKCVSENEDADTAVRQLVDLANANGGSDNITVVLIRF